MWKIYLKDLLIHVTILAIEKLVDVIKKYGDTDDKLSVKRMMNR